MESSARHAHARPLPSVAHVRAQEGSPSRCHALVDDDLGLFVVSEGHGRGLAAEAVAAATVRACTRLRAESAGRAGEGECRALVAGVADELHRLCMSQRAYGTMAASLAVALLGPRRATMAIVGDCVGFVGGQGALEPKVCGQSMLLGSTARPAPSVVDVRRESGVHVVLAVGSFIELAAVDGCASPDELIAGAEARAWPRDAGFVWLDLTIRAPIRDRSGSLRETP